VEKIEPNIFQKLNKCSCAKENNQNDDSKPIAKKRGRKPKGGKIIQQTVSINNNISSGTTYYRGKRRAPYLRTTPVLGCLPACAAELLLGVRLSCCWAGGG
jgi:hypothetical protein